MTEIHTTAALRSSERVLGGTTVVALSGEIDLLTAQPLSARLDMLTAGPHPDLVLDLRSVSFIDCAGLGVLCRARNRTAARGGRLRFVTGDTGFLRILRHARLGGVFEIHARLPHALAAKPESAAPPPQRAERPTRVPHAVPMGYSTAPVRPKRRHVPD